MTWRRLDDLACFGAPPAWAAPLPVGQVYLPEWSAFENAFRGIFARRHFTNHGPLVRELDARFAEHLGVRHAICVTNATVGLMVAAKALDLRGKVIVPAFTFPATVQALTWAGLTPTFCDVDPDTHTISADLAEPLVDDDTSGILGVHLWGRACDPDRLTRLCDRKDLALFFDAAHAIGCTHGGKAIGGLGRVEVFSFHATKILNGAEGGCLTTDDDELASRIRTVRNFHLSESFAPVALRINGKMSEAQAAMALLGLSGLEANIARNRDLHDLYRLRAQHWPGLRLIEPHAGEAGNYQYCVIEVTNDCPLGRDDLFRLLRAENVLARRYFHPGAHRIPPYSTQFPVPPGTLPATERLCATLLQLPQGASVDMGDVERICDLLDFSIAHGTAIAERLAGEE